MGGTQGVVLNTAVQLCVLNQQRQNLHKTSLSASMCNGMQIRSHAAAALVNLGPRDLYEGQLEEALRVFCDAFAGLQGNSMPGQDFAESGMCYCTIY